MANVQSGYRSLFFPVCPRTNNTLFKNCTEVVSTSLRQYWCSIYGLRSVLRWYRRPCVSVDVVSMTVGQYWGGTDVLTSATVDRLSALKWYQRVCVSTEVIPTTRQPTITSTWHTRHSRRIKLMSNEIHAAVGPSAANQARGLPRQHGTPYHR